MPCLPWLLVCPRGSGLHYHLHRASCLRLLQASSCALSPSLVLRALESLPHLSSVLRSLRAEAASSSSSSSSSTTFVAATDASMLCQRLLQVLLGSPTTPPPPRPPQQQEGGPPPAGTQGEEEREEAEDKEESEGSLSLARILEKALEERSPPPHHPMDALIQSWENRWQEQMQPSPVSPRRFPRGGGGAYSLPPPSPSP